MKGSLRRILLVLGVLVALICAIVYVHQTPPGHRGMASAGTVMPSVVKATF
jgi:hypothetical protein